MDWLTVSNGCTTLHHSVTVVVVVVGASTQHHCPLGSDSPLANTMSQCPPWAVPTPCPCMYHTTLSDYHLTLRTPATLCEGLALAALDIRCIQWHSVLHNRQSLSAVLGVDAMPVAGTIQPSSLPLVAPAGEQCNAHATPSCDSRRACKQCSA